MKERPILFSAPMVKALLAGTKTQTRSVVKHGFSDWNRTPSMVHMITGSDGLPCFTDSPPSDLMLARLPLEPGKSCPYGVPGDLLWAKETWRASSWEGDESAVPCADIDYRVDGTTRHVEIGGDADIWRDKQNAYALAHGGTEVDDCIVRVDADGMMNESPWPWRSPIFLPRWASRLSLRVTSIRVERVQDITEADAIAEGIREVPGQEGAQGAWWTGDVSKGAPLEGRSPIHAYRLLWCEINGNNSWGANPWTWVVGFGVMR